MATTKRARSPSKTAAKAEPSLATSTARSIKSRPYASAAALGVVAAAAAGAWLFKKRGRSVEETTDELKTLVKDGLEDAKSTLKTAGGAASKSIKSAREAVAAKLDPADTRSQREIAEEALSLKDTATPAEHPVDETVANQLKAGAVAY